MTEEDPVTCNGIVEYGKWVIFRMPSGNEKLLLLNEGLKNIDLGKFGSFKAELVLGKKFGYSFEIVSEDSVIPYKRESFIEIEGQITLYLKSS